MASCMYWAFQSTRALSAKPSAPSWLFLAVAIGPAQPALVAVEDDPSDAVAGFVAVEADAGLAAVLFAVDPAEEVRRLGDPAELGDRVAEDRAHADVQVCGPGAALAEMVKPSAKPVHEQTSSSTSENGTRVGRILSTTSRSRLSSTGFSRASSVPRSGRSTPAIVAI